MQNDMTHFNNAVELFEREFSHADLVNLLQNGNVVEKQFATLNLKDLNNENEAHLLISHLVGVDGKIREVVAFKLVEFIKVKPELFLNVENFDYFVNGTIDIDGNVCRKVIEASIYLKYSEEFSKYYAEGLNNIIETALDEISKFTFRDKKYTINKQIFKIYWCLEAIKYFYEFLPSDKLKNILAECSKLSEYTVREKCAEIIKHLDLDEELSKIMYLLEHDENYYVRKVFLNN